MHPTTSDEARPLEAIAGFTQLLREHGLKVGIAEQHDMVRTAIAVPPNDFKRLSASWRAITCHNAKQWKQWPDLFERYFQTQKLKGTVKTSGISRQTRQIKDMRQLVQDLHEELGGSSQATTKNPLGLDTAVDAVLDAGGDAAPRAQGGASRVDALHDRSLTLWLPQDLARLQALADALAQRLRKRLTRRWHVRQGGQRLDIRQSCRASLSTGGTPVKPVWKRRCLEKPRLFVLVDVSRSMETHAQLFLRIARALLVAMRSRVFVFHTRLTEITPLLQRDSAQVQEKINALTAGFGGGTRIATSLTDFYTVHARSQLRRGSRVWIFSDGFDADEPSELGKQLQCIARRGARIEWFHPGNKMPQSMALQGCEPLIQAWHPMNSLRDLETLTKYLN